MIRLLLSLFFALAFCLGSATYSVAQTAETAPNASSADVEQTARAVGKQLRCVVCQNQSIEESDAELAADMRRIVRERLREGATEDEVIAMMRDRYGDYVLLNPPVQANTAVLWGTPLLLVLGVGWFIWTLARRRERTAELSSLTEDEQAALAKMKRDLT